MKTIIAAALLLFSFSAAAQTSERDKAIEGFATDLAEVQARIQSANAKAAQVTAAPASWQDGAAVLKDDAVARSEPNKTSTALATLPEGSKVDIVSQTSDWSGVLLSGDTADARVGWVTKSALGAAAGTYTQADYKSVADDVLDVVIQEAKALLEKTKNNPYVRISGFTTEIGFTGVSLSVQFEFK